MMKKFTLGIVDMQQKAYSNSNNDKEIHILSSINDPLQDFEHQLSAILDAWRQVAETESVKPVFQRFYLSDIVNQAEAVQNAIIGHEYPASMIQQAPANGTKIALWAIYMTNAQTKKLEDGLFQVTSGYGSFYWSTCMTAPEGTPEEQTDKIMRRYIRQLEDNDMTLAQNCLRTWFFVNDIDNNYHGMVVARNKVFSEHRHAFHRKHRHWRQDCKHACTGNYGSLSCIRSRFVENPLSLRSRQIEPDKRIWRKFRARNVY